MKANMIIVAAMAVMAASTAEARVKLVALPERSGTVIRLDNPQSTLIEEERVLTLQKGLNKVDFSWKGVSIDVDSIRLTAIDHPDKVTILSISYPPDEAALVWDISSGEDFAERVRISYLLSNIDRLITYKAIADKDEKAVDLSSFLVLRNFSGEDFDSAKVLLDYGSAFEQGIKHEETKEMLFFRAQNVPVRKVWTFDAALPWDAEKLDNKNVGIPVSYRIVNDDKSGLGKSALWGGKARLFQQDGQKSTIFLGEDMTRLVPVGEKTELYIGDSRDIVVTQRKMKDEQVPVKKNDKGAIVLYDTDEVITAKIENFKDSPAVLTLIEHIGGQWDMEKCSMDYERKDAGTLVFEIELAAHGKKDFEMHYHRRNLRP